LLVLEKNIDLIIYEIIEIPSNIYSKYCSGIDLAWCDGFLINMDEIDSKIQSQELVKNNKFHIKRIHYCQMEQFPKEFKNQYGADIKILDARYSPIFSGIAKHLRARHSQPSDSEV